jgi:hypothetical protein
MSKIIKILGTGCTGGFSSYPDLSARFTAWLVFTLISLGAFTFDAWISYSVFAEYLEYIGSTGNVAGLILSTSFALAATVSVSVIAYAFVSYRRSIGTGEKLSDSLRFAGYLAGFLYLTFAAVSVLANIQGATQAAERSAQAAAPLDDSRLTATTNEWTKEKQATAARYDTELRDLKSRIAAIENGTSKEQGRINGKRGNVTWQGNLTTYGRALLAELRQSIQAKEAERAEQLQALDNTYQTRLSTESASFDRIAGKHSERKERATTAIRLIVFLIYPIALLIAIFNAHFLLDASFVINAPGEAQASIKQRKRTPNLTGTLATNTGNQIGFKLPYMERKGATQNDTFEGFDPAQFKADILHEIKGMLADGKNTPLPVKGDNFPPVQFQFSSTRQPDRSAPKKHGKRADSIEARAAILATYRAIKAQGQKPTYEAISKATRYSKKTVGNHIREMKREKIIY